MPKVSVIIPTYNRALYIDRAVRSVLAQTYTDFEVIVVDDGSTDDTPARVQALAQAAPRVRYLRHETNQGAQIARNTGIQVAKGQHIALLDSDDEWLPHKLERQILLYQQASDRIGVVYAGYLEVSDNGPRPRRHLPTIRGDIYHHLLTSYGVPILTLLIKRECLEKAGPFSVPIRAYQEWDLCIRLARHCEFDFVPDCLAIYHIHSSPTISKDLLRSAWGYLDVVEAHREEILWECGPATLGRHYISAGQQFMLADQSDLARQAFLQAARITPFSPRVIAYLSVTLLGRRGYQVLRSIKHRVRSLTPGLSGSRFY